LRSLSWQPLSVAPRGTTVTSHAPSMLMRELVRRDSRRASRRAWGVGVKWFNGGLGVRDAGF
jgi:hypothetical protein